MRRGPAMIAAAVALALMLAAPTAAMAAPEDFRSIPVRETGTVLRINDGDTFEFRPDGSSPVRVRVLGINTPEVTGWQNSHFDSDMCGGPQAYQLLSSIMPVGSRVQLRSSDAASSNRGRILRYVFAQNPATGAFDVDVSAAMARAGMAMWFSLEGETGLSQTYRAIVDQAQAAGVGIWDLAYCTSTEQPDARISLVVTWDAPSNDAANLNGESVIIRNLGSVDVDLSGWLLRDSSLEAWFVFPGGTVIAPGDYRAVHVGSGTPGGHDLYMGSTSPIFPNLVPGQYVGDGAYLLDRSTTPRAWFEYPCLADCVTDPLRGKATISSVNAVAGPGRAAVRANQEYVVVKNISSEPIVLDGYFLRRKVSTYPFIANTTIRPGATVKVRIGKGRPDAATQYWGMSGTLLNDTGDRVQLVSPTNVVISQKKW